jgi:hypothetical protein
MKRNSDDKVPKLYAIAAIIVVSTIFAFAAPYWSQTYIPNPFEKIEIRSIHVMPIANGYVFVLSGMNTGPNDAYVTSIYFNGKPQSEYQGLKFSFLPCDPAMIPRSIKVGEEFDYIVTINGLRDYLEERGIAYPFNLIITLHTKVGRNYNTSITLLEPLSQHMPLCR